MKLPLLLTVAAGLALVVVALSAMPSSPVQAPAPTPPMAAGHLILQIEGDANGLAIVQVTRKPDPVGHQAKVQASHQVVMLSADGAELASVPLDLSHFDLDPTRVGMGPTVEGCVIRDTRVGALASVPGHPDLARIEIRAGSRLVGILAGDGFHALMARSERR